MMVYDPLLSSEEKAALNELGCTNIEQNEVIFRVYEYIHTFTLISEMYVQLCRRRVQTYTLFYMPHCGQAMYNNLLWANWSPHNLSKVALIGNSFQSYMERSVMIYK